MIFTSKRADLVVREIGDELLVQASSGQQWHALDARAAAVFLAVDGRRDLVTVAAASGTDADTAAGILTELADLGLVGAPSGFDRRAMLRRSAVVLGSAGIMTVLAPATMAAASTASGVSIRSSADVTLFITESAVANGPATMTAPTTTEQRRLATFITSTALAPVMGQTRVSYRSLDRTTAYIRHAGFAISVTTNAINGGSFAADATFRPVAALNGIGTSVSFEAVNFPGYYITRVTNVAGSSLGLIQAPNAGLASFVLQTGGLA